MVMMTPAVPVREYSASYLLAHQVSFFPLCVHVLQGNLLDFKSI